ncbi:MAG: hypothetical protein WDN45_01770 [Caulobacteraceae bacterium]
MTDFDSWDRCITRGFPASMLPFRYNNGVQILQAPGYVIINLEMIHDARIIPSTTVRCRPSPSPTGWAPAAATGRATPLVVETSNIRPGASPLNMATLGVPANNTIPMTSQAHVTERFTLIDANTMTYELTYSDPLVFTKPFTARMDWPRNEKYEFFEYACHEGDEQVRNYIVANRALRQQVAEGKAPAAPARRNRQPEGAPAAGAAPAGARPRAPSPRAEAQQPQRQ